MSSFNLRRYNKAALEAELEGHTDFPGRPCKVKPLHVTEDGTTMRDTVRRTGNLCENGKRESWMQRKRVS